MGQITFRFLDWTHSECILPWMFDILYTNMSRIAPTGNSYDDDKRLWISYMAAEAQGNRQVILMYAGEALAGYFQYSVTGDTLLIEEIEILPEYQGTLLFFFFIKYTLKALPADILHAEAYINKNNRNSMTIAEKLGMGIIGENGTGKSWHYRGGAKDLRARLR